MRSIIARFLADRRGATAVEYSLIVGVLSLVIVSAVEMTGNSIRNVWVSLANAIDESWQD